MKRIRIFIVISALLISSVMLSGCMKTEDTSIYSTVVRVETYSDGAISGIETAEGDLIYEWNSTGLSDCQTGNKIHYRKVVRSEKNGPVMTYVHNLLSTMTDNDYEQRKPGVWYVNSVEYRLMAYPSDLEP